MSGLLSYLTDCAVHGPRTRDVHLYLILTTGYDTTTNSQKIG
jgi:hypothetical protein